MRNFYNLLSIAGLSMLSLQANAKMNENTILAFQQQPLPAAVSNAYHAMSLTGFSHDVVANGAGQANSTTTATIDFSNEYYSADFVPTTPFNGASAAVVGGGLPANGQVSSAVTAGVSYQLADYNAANALLLRPLTTSEGTLQFAAPYTATSVYILWVATEAQANNVTITIHFEDGTSQIATNQIAYDWVGGSSAIALNNLGRVGAGITQWAQLNQFSEVGSCKLFEKKVDVLPANQAKPITGVSFNYASSGDYQSLAVFGISVLGEALGVRSQSRNLTTVYPNPSSGTYFVNSDKPITRITAINTIGQAIKTEKNRAISLSDFPRGMYMLQIQFEDGVTETRKVIRN